MKYKFLLIALLAILVILPLPIGDFERHVMIMAYYYAILAISWAFLAGYVGVSNFGHAALITVGGYTMGLLFTRLNLPLILSIAAGIAATGLVGAILGFICLRLRGTYLSLATLGFSEIVRTVVTVEWEVTGGPMGLELPKFLGTKLIAYYAVLAILCLTYLILHKILNSPIGLALRAIGCDEQAANTSGVSLLKYKVTALVISSLFPAIIGIFYGFYIGLLTPDVGSLYQQFFVVAAAITGGIGTLIGPVVGGLITEVLYEGMRFSFGGIVGLYIFMFGVVMLAIVRTTPGGIAGFLSARRQWFAGLLRRLGLSS